MLITQVNAENIKEGLSFRQSLSRLTLFVGPNGSGKSARAEALMLALLGYIPEVAKKNGEILDTYGNGEKLIVGFKTDDNTDFLRRFARKPDGTVSQNVMLDHRGVSKEEYAKAMASIKIFDLRAFLKLSEQAQIDLIFGLFPPAGDVKSLNKQIEEQKKKRDKLQSGIRTLEETSKRLKTSRAAIELPSGTLVELTAAIEEHEKQLAGARAELEAARIEEARAAAEAKATKEAEEKAARDQERIEREAKAKAESDVWQKHQEELQAAREEIPTTTVTVQPPSKKLSTRDSVGEEMWGGREEALTAGRVFSGTGPTYTAQPTSASIESIQSILDTIQRTCGGTCTAALVAKRELKKYRPGKAA